MKLIKISKLLIISSIAVSLLASPVYATETNGSGEHPIEHGTTTEASVSEKVDTSSNKDDEISTQFYIYIPKEKVKDVPYMGDTGIDLTELLIVTIVVGLSHLALNKYANNETKNCENI